MYSLGLFAVRTVWQKSFFASRPSFRKEVICVVMAQCMRDKIAACDLHIVGGLLPALVVSDAFYRPVVQYCHQLQQLLVTVIKLHLLDTRSVIRLCD